MLFSVGILWICLSIPVVGADEPPILIENGYSFVIENGSAIITGYSGPGGEVNVPWSLGGMEVIEIRARAFAGNETLIIVNLPNSIRKIGQAAFSGCTKMLNIRLSARIVNLPDEVFKDCIMLGSILIPERVSSIGYNAFNGCSGLTYIYFEGTRRLKTIGAGAFHATPWFEQQKEEFVIVGNGVLIKYNGSAKQVTLPWNAFYIADAFENNTVIEEVILAEWTKGILTNAFRGCSSLKTIKFGEWVSAIGLRAFENCTSLETIVLPERVKTIGSYAFAGCQNLKDLLLPQQLLKLQTGVFKDCKSLQSIILPESVNEIGANAFENCWSLEFLQMGKKVEKIGKAAFSGCSGLTSIQLPDSVIEIGSGAFQNCGLRTINLPDGVLKLESGLFTGCFQLKKIGLSVSLISIDETAFPDSIPQLMLQDKNSLPGKEKILENSDGSSLPERFVQDHGLQYEYKSIKTNLYEFKQDVDSGTYTIVQNFQNDWREIIIPSLFNGIPVTGIGTGAFQDQPLLETVVIGDSHEKIMDWAFSYCPKLKEVAIGKSVKMIGANAFSGDSLLEIVVIPPSVQTFGERAFMDCPLLTIVGAAGSAAESFARMNGIPFRAELSGN
ncbi:MAG: leucine-rich repeat domain-containing protein [Flexilinea sp.]